MTIQTKPWDSAEFLRDEEDLAGYLLVALEDEEQPPIFGNAVKVAARARGGFAQLSLESGIAAEELVQASTVMGAEALPVLRALHNAYARLAHSRMVA